MTIYDVSEKAGVSIATVSRVLNGSENVSAETRKKVLAVIEACDYTPNTFASTAPMPFPFRLPHQPYLIQR